MPQSPAGLLLVEPEDFLRVLTTRILRECGYNVVEAANGRVALELLDAIPSEHFDLIVTNSRLPGIDGYRFVTDVLARRPHAVERCLDQAMERPDPEAERNG